MDRDATIERRKEEFKASRTLYEENARFLAATECAGYNDF